MNKFLASLTPEDVLGFIVVIGMIVLKFKGMNGSTDNIITAVVSYRLGQHSKKGGVGVGVGSDGSGNNDNEPPPPTPSHKRRARAGG